MNHLLNNDQGKDVLPTNHNRKVQSRYSKSSSSYNGNSLTILFYVNILLVMFMCYGFSGLVKQYKSVNNKIRVSNERKEKVLVSFKGIDSEIDSEKRKDRELKVDLRNVESKLSSIDKKVKDKKKSKDELEYDHSELLEVGQDRIGKTISILGHAYSEQELQTRMAAKEQAVDLLQSRIQQMSRREVTERFGPGPHLITFDLMIPDTMAGERRNGTFSIQTASLDTMPHSVHLFLEQVYHHLWDGCAFLAGRANQRIQASPFRDITLRDKSLYDMFRKLDLDTVSFQEYNRTYPHVKGSLAFSGRPGGPDFYINLADNTHLYGPAGEKHDHHTLEEEGDPVFARVVDGFDLVQRIASLPTRPPGEFFTNPVVIQKVTLHGVTPGMYRHTYYEEGYVGLHDHTYYQNLAEEEETQNVEVPV